MATGGSDGDRARRRTQTGSDKREEKVKFFVIQKDGKVIFDDGSEAKLGDAVYDAEYREIGKIFDVGPAQERTYIQKFDGDVEAFSAFSIRSKGMTAEEIPF